MKRSSAPRHLPNIDAYEGGRVADRGGATSKPLWGRVVYHLLTSELDAAADWYEQMIEERDPFALLYARTPASGACAIITAGLNSRRV